MRRKTTQHTAKEVIVNQSTAVWLLRGGGVNWWWWCKKFPLQLKTFRVKCLWPWIWRAMSAALQRRSVTWIPELSVTTSTVLVCMHQYYKHISEPKNQRQHNLNDWKQNFFPQWIKTKVFAVYTFSSIGWRYLMDHQWELPTMAVLKDTFSRSAKFSHS